MWRSELFQCLRVVFKAEVSILTVNLSNLTLNLLKSLRQVYLLCTLWFPGPHEKQTFKKCLLWDVQGDPAGVPRSPAAGLILAWISHIWLHCLTCESPGSPQKPSNGAAVLPDVARLDLCSSTCPSEHGAANTLLQRTFTTVCHFLLMWCDYEIACAPRPWCQRVCMCVAAFLNKVCTVRGSVHVCLWFNRWLTMGC